MAILFILIILLILVSMYIANIVVVYHNYKNTIYGGMSCSYIYKESASADTLKFRWTGPIKTKEETVRVVPTSQSVPNNDLQKFIDAQENGDSNRPSLDKILEQLKK